MDNGHSNRMRFPPWTWMFPLLVLTACAPVFSGYRFISLERYGDARVVERDRVTPGERGFFVGELPTRYEIGRPDYTLVVEIDKNINIPSVDILVQPPGQRVVEFIGKPEVDFPTCVYQQESPYEEFRWTYFITCDGGFDKLDKVIRFNVRDLEGNLLGEEAIPYEIKRDGFFVYIDAL
jgi:hypothetical protein